MSNKSTIDWTDAAPRIREELRKRYLEQCEKFPNTSAIPMHLYVSANFKSAMENEIQRLQIKAIHE